MTTPAKFAIEIVHGDTFKEQWTDKVKDCDTGVATPVDLSSVDSISGQLYDLDGTLLVPFSCAVTDASNGEFEFSLTDTQTAALVGTDTERAREAIGRYNIKYNWNDGTVETILYGKVTLNKAEGA